MARNNTYAIRQLVPKSYHFDGYNELNCPNSRDKPFFGDNVIHMGEYHLTTRLHSHKTMYLEFSSVCSCGKISFEPYVLTLEEFVSKLKKAINENSDFITFSIIPKYSLDTSICLGCPAKNTDCTQIRKRVPSKIMAAVSFNPSDVKDALATYYEINNTTKTGGNNMKATNNKKLFGMNFEMGLSKDPNIKSTMMGVSVRNPANGNWYVFDQATGTRKNMAGMKFGDFPVILLPTKVLNVGDLIKMDNRYHYVKEICTVRTPGGGQTIKIIGAADGQIREVYPEESFIPGLSMYTKVMAFDIKTLTDPVSKEGLGSNIMAAICMMQWANGGDNTEFSLDNFNDDSFNGLGACLPLLLASKDGNLGSVFQNPDGTPNLAMMFMLGNGNGNSDSNDMMKMVLLTQLLGGSNPLAGIVQPATTAAPAVATTVAATEKVACEKCGAVYDDPEVAFCTKCGGKTHKVAPPRTTCRKCNAQLKEGAAFCHACGTKVAPDTCPNCGTPYDLGDAFCSKCGTSLKAAPVVIEPPKAPEAIEPAAPPTTPAV